MKRFYFIKKSKILTKILFVISLVRVQSKEQYDIDSFELDKMKLK